MQNKHEKKGIVRIVFGYILITFQITGYILGSSQEKYLFDYEIHTPSIMDYIYDFAEWIGYNIFIIVGIFLLIFGYISYFINENKYEEEIKKEKYINHQFSSNNREFSQKKPQLSSLNDIVLCPFCGADVSSDENICHVCGAEITR